MRIDRLHLVNFKGFADRELTFHPAFNLVVGENGSGKTSVLDALSVAAGSWLLGLREVGARHIAAEDVRLVAHATETAVNWEQQFPCVVDAAGQVLGQSLSWKRSLNGAQNRTTTVDARDIKDLASSSADAVMLGEEIVLPLLSYYGTGRLWREPRADAKVESGEQIGQEGLSRFDGYRNSVDPRLSVAALVQWFARQSWMAFQRNGAFTPAYQAVRQALTRNVQSATDVTFDAKLGQMVVEFAASPRQPFTNLSDGQRCMLALVGDIARKAATLNPHLGPNILSQTPGIVLIDELDLHLHPKWQRTVIEDLRTTFPAVQFICTTHSPFLIQSLRSGEELVMLGGQPTAQLGDLSIDTIARGIQGVHNPEVSARYESMRADAKDFLQTLDEAMKAPSDKLDEYRTRLADRISPYADNPAFQAFLELKRAAKLGE